MKIIPSDQTTNNKYAIAKAVENDFVCIFAHTRQQNGENRNISYAFVHCNAYTL